MIKQKKKRKTPKGKGKGTKFERDICKLLSLWWTDGKRTDVFWRTAGSGARATTRSRRNKATFGQYGDVQATDPIGQPLIDMCTIEIKKGYSRQTIFDLIDKLPTETKQPYRRFIEQARQDNGDSESHYWMLITKRDYKETLVIIPLNLYLQLSNSTDSKRPVPYFKFKLTISDCTYKLFGTTLDEFFKWIKPENIKALL